MLFTEPIKTLYTIREHEQILYEPDRVTKKCWSVIRQDNSKYVCKNPKTCQYSHICVCNNEDCDGKCEEMLQYLSIPRSRRERKNFVTAVNSTSKTMLAFDRTSPTELINGQIFDMLPVLQTLEQVKNEHCLLVLLH